MKNDLSKMMCLDLFLSSRSKTEYKEIAKNLISTENSMPLLSWDISGQAHHRRLQELQKQRDLEKLLSFAAKHNWNNSIATILENGDYETLVLTNAAQKIVWVNKGFSSMTGYSANFAVNRSPSFLSGPETSPDTRRRIAENLNAGKPFKEVIVNYKKNNEKYHCELNIFPLYRDEVTHYLALEKQVSSFFV